MWFALKAYLTFIIKSTNAHGVHSPFVYDLLTKGLKAPIAKPIKKTLTKHREGLYADHQSFEMQDLGAGSRVFKGNNRHVNKVARVAGMTKKEQRQLVGLCLHSQPKRILELGTSMGLGTAALCLANPSARIVSVEGCRNTLNRAGQHLTRLEHPGLELKNTSFQDALKTTQGPFDLIYLDGDHGLKQTLHYFEQILPLLHKNGLLILDDIHWSKDMEEAWQTIAADPRIHLSIDTFGWGIIGIRPGQRKEHFTLRV